MSTYQLPAEPDVDVVWTVQEDGFTTRWERSGDKWKCTWQLRDEPVLCTWVEVLGIGHTVYDVHPDLGEADPLPWGLAGGCVVDASGDIVDVHRPCNAGLVVRAVNAYAESLDR